ncbi:MAG: NGG1p interacting factor NIF3 [Candidatus Electrothrix sp. AR3]|nr:NGG1p interacting factor NIF3 [Candidatus Electrothrix sp. AR3]
MYKLCFYVPESHLIEVKEALFNEGAGKFGNFDLCSWQTLGAGQFRGLDGSSQFIGNKNELVELSEYKVEMVCQDKYLKAVLKRLLQVHPYQTPAYSVYEIKTIEDL